MTLNQTLRELHAAFADSDQKMPALFVGHGSPMNASELGTSRAPIDTDE